jgi:hypothetical protein
MKPNMDCIKRRKRKFTPGRGMSKTISKKSNVPKISYSHRTWEFRPKLKNEAIVLHSTYSGRSIEFYSRCVDAFRSLITKLIRNHGYADGSSRWKIIRSYTFDLIEGRKPENPEWLATSEKYSVPSQLGSEIIALIVEYLNIDQDDATRLKIYQTLNTLLYSSRIIEGLVPMSLDSIEDEFKPIDNDLLSSFRAYAHEKLKEWNFNKVNLERENKQMFTNLSRYRFNLKKNGPNGKPKIETALEEAECLRKSKLWSPFTRLCEELGIAHLPNYLDGLTLLNHGVSEQIVATPVTRLRVLSPVPDSDFKVRVVAVVDFWTQLALEPVRAWVRHVTMKLFKEQNFVDSHDRGFEALREFQIACLNSDVSLKDKQLKIEKLKFYDFTSWTDRYHRDLQKIIMTELFSSRLSEAWAQLTVHCSWYVPSAKREVKYKQGQGMGTNGSFDIATLTDHIFINFIYDTYCSEAFIPKNNRCYGKVGDDLWIYDPLDIFTVYYEKINLPINLAKSKTYSDLLGSVGEFCSRISINGIDVSRISPKIISASGNFTNIPSLLNVCAKVGIQLHRFDFEQLSQKTKSTEETYFDLLQHYILSAYLVGSKDLNLFGSVSIEYLEEGGWISEELKELLGNQSELDKIILSHSIMRLIEVEDNIEAKLMEVGRGKISLDIEERMDIQNECHDFFNTNSIAFDLAKKFFSADYVLPKQIIVLERCVDQLQITSNGLMSAPSLQMLNSPKELSEYVQIMSDIVNRSCYDRGNIRYDRSRWLSELFSLTKTIRRLSADRKVLYLSSEDDVMMVSSLLNYQSLQLAWLEQIPQLEVLSVPATSHTPQ